MPWRRTNVLDQRLQFVIRASEPGSCVAGLSREYGISRQTGHSWLRRYAKGGAQAVLEERSRRPHSSPRATARGLVEEIQRLRQNKPDWGARKLLEVLRGAHGEWREREISPSTVHRILEREGLIAAGDRHPAAVQRFERQAPNELWQMDFKGPQGFNQGIGPLSILDDYSRYLLVLRQLGSTRAQGVQAAWQETFASSGLPEYLLLDHGIPWYNGWSAWGWSELTVWILQQGVHVIWSGIRHPQTQGKVERMHGALQRAIRKRKQAVDQPWLDEFRHEYNHVRPHEGIGMRVPAQRWRPSERRYRGEPRDWEYPAGWEVHRLNGEGRLNWRGQRWEVSRALRHQRVGLQRCQERILVYFCNLALREIHLHTGQNIILPANPFRDLQC